MTIALPQIRAAGFDVRRDTDGWKLFDPQGRPLTRGGLRREAIQHAAKLMAADAPSEEPGNGPDR